MLANPKNCEMVILKHDGSGRLQLDSRCEVEFETVDIEHAEDSNAAKGNCATSATNGATKQSITKVVGYTKHRRLKLLPPHLIQPRTVRMYHNECT